MEIVLPVPVMAQELRLWCWAAIASGVSQLGGAPGLSQCEIATRLIGLACCASPPACNTSQDLAAAITSIPMSCVAMAPIDFPMLANQIQVAGRPVGVRLLNRLDFSAHFVLLTGCDPAMETVIATDPWGTVGSAAPRYRMALADVHNYGGWGTWTHSFIIS
jgi:hypothetical protein